MGQAKRRKEAGDPTYSLPKQKKQHRHMRPEYAEYTDPMPMLMSLLMMSKFRRFPKLPR